MKRASPSNTTNHVNNQQQVPGSHPPQGQAYPTATNVSAPPPVDYYPSKDGGPAEYPQRRVSHKTKRLCSNFWTRCCACFCRNIGLDECFE
ncbi:hypothetical protein Lal_00017888 [Lupinus albus]|uniref:Uncharacterized protein n=1 Tax=Lupinus albus TaxID=3870 RepID=A0A6A5M6E6_LUPAL|nr:hypothetical protein Lalb_Chr25g0284961 [Lupinus albus]KAF1866505.1 hypothetical protein Lal_00017888 [Lupinus albus]